MTTHTILAVDDEPASLRALQRALADECRVMSTTSATEGLAALATQRIGLVVVDQRMPEMSGTELLAQVAREQPEISRVLLTGYTGLETLVDAINAGQVYYYLTKPWEPRELRLVVRRGLERYDAEVERRRLLAEIEQAYRRVRREADQKGRLLAVAAHELGTPVHVLSHAVAFLAEAELPPAASHWLDMAQRSVEWLGRGLAQMTNAARWRTATFKLHCRAVDVAELLEPLRRTFEPILQARHLILSFEVPPTLPAVFADRTWLGRALSNLLSNAVRFTPDGGTITVTATACAPMVEVGVIDSGVGIDAELLDEVFEPFSAAAGDLSLHASGRFEFESRGLGLGLAITKAIVDRHGGSISVRSQRGAGSRFTVSLPVCSEAVSRH